MSDPKLLSPNAIELPPVQVWDAIVIADTTAPTDELFVRIPEFDDDSGESWKHGPCVWSPLVSAEGLFYPKAEDTCVVAVPLDGNPVVVDWVHGASVPDVLFSEGGGDRTYEHSQGVAAKEWLIEHGLGKLPCIEVFNTIDQQIEPQLVPVDDNSVILRFNIDISGRAVLN